MSTQRCFYPDDFRSTTGLYAAAGPCENLGAKIIADDPGDLLETTIFAGTVIESPSGSYHAYYTARNVPENKFAIAMATSDDGLNWHKPKLGQVKIDNQDTCQLKIKGLPQNTSPCQPIVHILPDGSWRMYFWLHGGNTGGFVRYITAESPDGINWSCPDYNRVCVYHPSDCAMPAFDWTKGLALNNVESKKATQTIDGITAKRIRSNDATFVVRNPFENLWEMYTVWLLPLPLDDPRRCNHDNAPSVLRTIHRRTSDDGLKWSDPQLLIVPDQHDPIDQQFYHLAVNFLDRDRIGFLGNYRLDEQTMDMELCFSRDGRHWHRPLRGGFISRTDPPNPGSLSAYPAQGIVRKDDHLIIPHTAGRAKHNAYTQEKLEHDPMRNINCMTKFHQDRLMGLKTHAKIPGFITTQPFIMSDQLIAIDADIKGTLRYSLCDAFGRPMPGYSTNECTPITGDSHNHRLAWQNKNASELAFDAVTLRLEINQAAIYAIHS